MILLPLFKKKVPRLHGNPQKLDALIFFNFHDPGYMKSTKIRRFNFVQVSWPPGTWKSTKIRRFDFIQFSWPRVHENPQKYDSLIFFNFHDPGGTWKSTKIRQFKDIVQMAKRLEHLSGKNECCSAPNPRFNPFTTYVKYIHRNRVMTTYRIGERHSLRIIQLWLT